METRRKEWEEYKEFSEYQVMDMYPKKYNNLLTSGMWSNKDPKNVQILAIAGVDQNLADDSKKSSEKPNREPTRGDPAYTRELPP